MVKFPFCKRLLMRVNLNRMLMVWRRLDDEFKEYMRYFDASTSYLGMPILKCPCTHYKECNAQCFFVRNADV